MNNDRVIIVFGGAGFIAPHLLKRLCKQSSVCRIPIDIRAPLFSVSGVARIPLSMEGRAHRKKVNYSAACRYCWRDTLGLERVTALLTERLANR